MPVLVIWGKQDVLIPLDHGIALQTEFPNAELEVLDGCGHVPIADCPEEFDQVLVEFLTTDD
jgi:pimeloyl-ACP methyl ester carboxylesterase